MNGFTSFWSPQSWLDLSPWSFSSLLCSFLLSVPSPGARLTLALPSQRSHSSEQTCSLRDPVYASVWPGPDLTLYAWAQIKDDGRLSTRACVANCDVVSNRSDSSRTFRSQSLNYPKPMHPSLVLIWGLADQLEIIHFGTPLDFAKCKKLSDTQMCHMPFRTLHTLQIWKWPVEKYICVFHRESANTHTKVPVTLNFFLH